MPDPDSASPSQLNVEDLSSQIFDLWVQPELTRRELHLEVSDIRKVLVEMPPHGAPVVLLNEEVELVGEVHATRDITAGDEVTEADYDAVIALWPASIHEDSGWICFAIIGGSRVFAFDFRYNQGRALALLDAAEQFLAAARALHRELIDVQYRPAATPEDLLDGLNDIRPHIVHFSGHAGDAALLFDNASIDSPEGHGVPFELLARALGATADPPKLLVLNGCDTLDRAEVLLEATPVVIAMATEITDLAASAFAARFYAAVAAAQPIGPALRQGSVVLDLMGLDEGWKPNLLSRDDVAVDDLILVQVPIER